MFINGIDKILDNSIDDFYATIISKGNLKNIFKITNFVEKQNDIMNILINYLKMLNLKHANLLAYNSMNAIRFYLSFNSSNAF